MALPKLGPDSSNSIQRRLAGYLITLEVGDRIAPVRDLARSFRSSVGALSNALNGLEAKGIVEIERRGRMGSFMGDYSPGELWSVAETGPMVIGLTLPSNLCYEGLATGLKTIFTEAGIEVYMVFIRGSRTRLKALRENRCHVVVVSAFAAEKLCTRDERILMQLPRKTFVTGHRVFYRSHSPAKGAALKIAIDRDSYDQARLTELEFKGSNVKFVPVMFTRIHHLLSEGQVDAAVWTADDMQAFIGEDILDRPLSDAVASKLDGKNTMAALVARAENTSTHAIIRRILSEEKLTRIQNMVINGEILPEY
jgi:hypothetical protein